MANCVESKFPPSSGRNGREEEDQTSSISFLSLSSSPRGTLANEPHQERGARKGGWEEISPWFCSLRSKTTSDHWSPGVLARPIGTRLRDSRTEADFTGERRWGAVLSLLTAICGAERRSATLFPFSLSFCTRALSSPFSR